MNAKFLEIVREWCGQNDVGFACKFLPAEAKGGDGVHDRPATVAARVSLKDADGVFYTDIEPLPRLSKEMPEDYEIRIKAKCSRVIRDMRKTRMKFVRHGRAA